MFNQDLQKLVYEVVSADALFLGNVFFTYTQVYKSWLLMMSTAWTAVTQVAIPQKPYN